MRRNALLGFCSLVLQGSVNAEIACAQMPASSIVANRLVDSKSVGPVLNLKQTERFRGTLVLCGGGKIPHSIREEFYQLGNGNEGSLVLIPTASPRSDGGDYTIWIDYWSSFRWRSIEVVHVENRDRAFDPLLAQRIQQATAVWLSGGEQQRLSERYVGTPIEKELHSLLARGGVVGGTSAGAAIASSTMIASGVELPMFAQGMQFLPSVIIDQHFSQRKRHGRLIKAIEAHPNRIGVGIDESTGLFVNQDRSRVVGDGSVFLFQGGSGQDIAEEPFPGYRRLEAGDVLDTRVLEPLVSR